MTQILQSFSNFIGTITFNNFERRNALSMQLLEELIQALETFK